MIEVSTKARKAMKPNKANRTLSKIVGGTTLVFAYLVFVVEVMLLTMPPLRR